MNGALRAMLVGLPAVAIVAGAACKGEGEGKVEGPDDPRLDPQECAECHPTHHREWLGSMHAYAAEDPVFRAMNARGQRETNGELGDFCVQCHAPMAVRLGLTEDGLNLDDVPIELQGVTCYFCHNAEAVEGTHNNPITLANNDVMFGSVRDPVRNDFHRSEYSALLDEQTLESAELCGPCHDIVNGHGLHLERTFTEWQDTFMDDLDPMTGRPALYGLRCGSCHMGPPIDGPIADTENVRGDRRRHPHGMVAVDTAITPWPDEQLGPELLAEQEALQEDQRKSALCASICVNPDPAGGTNVDVWLHNEFTGHSWPSGSTPDRRAWLEMHAYQGDTELFATGVVPDGVALADARDETTWWFGDEISADGELVHMFWEAKEITDNLLPASEILSAQADASTWRARRYHVDGDVDRVTTQLNLRAIDVDVLDDLIESGDLDPKFRDAIPTRSVTPTRLEWTPDGAEFFDLYGPCVSSNNVCGAPVIGAEPPT